MRFEKILILDDELIIRKTLQEFCYRKRIKVRTASTVREALDQLQGDHGYDLMFLDINLPDGEGTDILEHLEGVEDAPLAIMITGQGTIQSAVRCMQLGAFDYLLKPFSTEQIELVLQKAAKYDRLVRVNQELASGDGGGGSIRRIIGQSAPMQTLYDMIRSVARTDATVMINGETGTGKELISHAIHQESLRRNKPFIKVNCAAVSESLIESEFFGHEKGAFTGAVNSRIGRFELADGGTLLLDEISEVSLTLQAKLLRVLQEKELERVGGTRTIRVDVRIIATTNRDLVKSIEAGDFREDLYYRLNVFPIYSPALRERKDDIPLIAQSFLEEFSRKHGRRLEQFSPAAIDLLLLHEWPGNVRELQNVVERAVILSHSGTIVQPSVLPMDIQMLAKGGLPARPVANAAVATATLPASGAAAATAKPASAAVDELLASDDLSLAAVERRLILKALERTGGNRSQAADLMQVSIRTLRNKLNQYKEEGRSEFAPYFA